MERHFGGRTPQTEKKELATSLCLISFRHPQALLQSLPLLDGRNPFRTTLKPWLKPEHVLLVEGNRTIHGEREKVGPRMSLVWLLI